MKDLLHKSHSRACKGFTLAEVVVSLGIMALVLSGLLTGYTYCSRRTEWSGYSLAAEAIAEQQVELIRAANWDTQALNEIDQTTNVPTYSVTMLDLPMTGSNAVYVTNYTKVTKVQVASSPAVYVKMIQTDAVWPWRGQRFTNTVVAYRSPDQ